MDKQRKILLFSVIGIFGLLILVSCGLFLLSPQKKDTIEDSHFGIKNLSTYVKKSDERKYIEWNIYALAFPSVAEGKESYTGYVRDDSFNETKDPNGTKDISFIVDVETVQQSWLITVKYGKDKKILPSGVIAACVNAKDIIYKNSTTCITPSMTNTPTDVYKNDPIVQSLPYNGPFYSINSTQIDGEIFIVVKIQTNHYANDATSIATFNRHKSSSITWMKERNPDLSSYKIEWRDFGGTPIDRKQAGTPL